MIAAGKAGTRTVEVLIAAGADVTAKSNIGAEGKEELDRARSTFSCGHHERSPPAAKSAAASDGTQPSRSVHGPMLSKVRAQIAVAKRPTQARPLCQPLARRVYS